MTENTKAPSVMAQFTADTPVVYRTGYANDVEATILAVAEDCATPIVARVDFPSGPEVMLFYPDGTRDDDDDLPRLVKGPARVSRFSNLYKPDGGAGLLRDTRAHCDETSRSGRTAVLEVIFENDVPVHSIIHPIAPARKESN